MHARNNNVITTCKCITSMHMCYMLEYLQKFTHVPSLSRAPHYGLVGNKLMKKAALHTHGSGLHGA